MADKYKHDYFNVTFPHEYVAVVEINRPAKLNSFIEVMWLNLEKIFNTLSHDPDVRAVILTAAGDKAFCAGLDVQAASQGELSGSSKLDGARTATRLRRHILEFQGCISAIEKCSKPVIALLHGVAFGLALDLCLAADVRLASSCVRLSIKEVDIGLAADIGTLTRLPHAGVPMSWAKEVALSAREFGAQEALRVGLVSGAVAQGKKELLEQGTALATLIAAKSPVAVQGTKELINYSRGRPVEEGLNYTAIWNAAYVQTQDVQEAITAGLRKKKVSFAKL